MTFVSRRGMMLSSAAMLSDSVPYPRSEPESPYETLPERLIREAMEAGEFDDLPGAGQPLPGAGVPDDELWWVRDWLKRGREQDRGEWNSA
jgi:hypothetical protein